MTMNSLETILNNSQKNPFIVSISHWMTDKPRLFKYVFHVITENKKSDNYKISKGHVEISNTRDKKAVKNDFLIFHTSEKSAILICEKPNEKITMNPPIAIPFRYSKINKSWIAESSYRNINNLFTLNEWSSSFGLLSELLCSTMKVSIYSNQMKISCHGPGGIQLNETRIEDDEDCIDNSNKDEMNNYKSVNTFNAEITCIKPVKV